MPLYLQQPKSTVLPTVFKDEPTVGDFQSLESYQAETPETFFDGKPVLHYQDTQVKAWCSKEQCQRLHFFSENATPSEPECYALENGSRSNTVEDAGVTVFVASHKLILFSNHKRLGLEIPYPSITLHAVKNFKNTKHPDDAAQQFTAVYMQIEFNDKSYIEDLADPIELTLIPSETVFKGGTPNIIQPRNKDRTTELFNAISTCSNLHPDPNAEDDEDEDDGEDRIAFEGDMEELDGLPGAFRSAGNGSLPPAMPGSSGWITADNVHEYFDEDGNWIEGDKDEVDVEDVDSGEFGKGAGKVRRHDEVEATETNGHGCGDDVESKRVRTE